MPVVRDVPFGSAAGNPTKFRRFAVASAAFGQSQPDGGFANLAARRMLKFSFTFVCQAPSSSTEPSTWR